jgi:hypothetical protein
VASRRKSPVDSTSPVRGRPYGSTASHISDCQRKANALVTKSLVNGMSRWMRAMAMCCSREGCRHAEDARRGPAAPRPAGGASSGIGRSRRPISAGVRGSEDASGGWACTGVRAGLRRAGLDPLWGMPFRWIVEPASRGTMMDYSSRWATACRLIDHSRGALSLSCPLRLTCDHRGEWPRRRPFGTGGEWST